MRAVLQRVRWARVTVSGNTVGEIHQGLLVLLGVARGDTPELGQKIATKLAGLRIFSDDAGKMNLSLQDIQGGCLVVSQFTLLADCKKGRRPSFVQAEEPEKADKLCRGVVESLKGMGLTVATGQFGADMQVELCNDGPVTILLDTDAM